MFSLRLVGTYRLASLVLIPSITINETLEYMALKQTYLALHYLIFFIGWDTEQSLGGSE